MTCRTKDITNFYSSLTIKNGKSNRYFESPYYPILLNSFYFRINILVLAVSAKMFHYYYYYLSSRIFSSWISCWPNIQLNIPLNSIWWLRGIDDAWLTCRQNICIQPGATFHRLSKYQCGTVPNKDQSNLKCDNSRGFTLLPMSWYARSRRQDAMNTSYHIALWPGPTRVHDCL